MLILQQPGAELNDQQITLTLENGQQFQIPQLVYAAPVYQRAGQNGQQQNGQVINGSGEDLVSFKHFSLFIFLSLDSVFILFAMLLKHDLYIKSKKI